MRLPGPIESEPLASTWPRDHVIVHLDLRLRTADPYRSERTKEG
jgi:hypothetical protein